MAGTSVAVKGMRSAGLERLLYDLGGYWNLSSRCTGALLGTIDFSDDPSAIREVIEFTAGHPYRSIAIHYPSNPANYRFGRLFYIDGCEYITNTKKKSAIPGRSGP